MPIQAQASDGSIHEFPDGVDPAVVDKAMKAYASSIAQSKTENAPENPLTHAAKVGAESLIRGPAKLAFDMYKLSPFGISSGLIPSVKATQNGLGDLISNVGSTPQNKPEQYLQSIGEGIGTAPFGGVGEGVANTIRSLVFGGLAGAGGQVGSDLTNGSGIGRVAGALLGGSPASAEKYLFHPDNARKMVQTAIGNIPDPAMEFGLASENAQTAAKQQIPQTTAQAFENAPGLQVLQNQIVASGKAPKTTAILQQQVGTALGKAKEAIGDLPGVQQASGAVANQSQKAADGSIEQGYTLAGNAFRKALGNNVQPLSDKNVAPFAAFLKNYAKANPNSNIETMANDVLDKIKNPEKTATKNSGPQILGPNGQPIAPQLASSYIQDPLALKQAVNDALDGFGPIKLNSDSVGRNESRAMATIREQLNNMFAKTTPQLHAANQAYEDVMDSVVNPLKEGPVGQIAGRIGAQEGVPAPSKISSILDKGTTPGSAVSPILTVARNLNKADPTAFASAVKSNLADKLAKATTTTGGQIDADALKNFHDSVYGNAAQKQGLKEQLIGTAEGQGLSSNALHPGFLSLMNTVGRLVNRPSSTAGVTTSQLGSMAGNNAASNIFKLFTFKREQGGAIESMYSNSAYKKLDHMFASPDGIQLLQKLAKNDPMGSVGQQAISSYLAAQAGSENQKDQK